MLSRGIITEEEEVIEETEGGGQWVEHRGAYGRDGNQGHCGGGEECCVVQVII